MYHPVNHSPGTCVFHVCGRVLEYFTSDLANCGFAVFAINKLHCPTISHSYSCAETYISDILQFIIIIRFVFRLLFACVKTSACFFGITILPLRNSLCFAGFSHHALGSLISRLLDWLCNSVTASIIESALWKPKCFYKTFQTIRRWLFDSNLIVCLTFCGLPVLLGLP